ncbi:MAG: Rpn family recombination-promoting nuclease/putative transposase [Proteobacteria bacterium]|nr:Rpn family recombination-promoting nuclease/putative transposase [Pseudomonadota bacterium]
MTKHSNDIYCSHDKLFKITWSNLENARSFLENYLPPDLLSIFDLNSLEICKGSFVEKDLKEFHSDLLYKVKTNGGSAYIYFLFEHKSYPDSLIHLQLLKYMIGIWDLGIKQNKRKHLDIIVPLVMYHGKTIWNSPENFGGLFTGTPDIAQMYIPDFQYLLFDLHNYSDQQIRGTIVSRLVMLMFKHIFDPDFED